VDTCPQLTFEAVKEVMLRHSIGGYGKSIYEAIGYKIGDFDPSALHDKIIDYKHDKGTKAIAVNRKVGKFATAKK
jgi:hypothetical protein